MKSRPISLGQRKFLENFRRGSLNIYEGGKYRNEKKGSVNCFSCGADDFNYCFHRL